MSLEELAEAHSVPLDLAARAEKRPWPNPAVMGLTSAEAAERLKKFGPNALSPPKQLHPLLQFLLKARAAGGSWGKSD